MRGSVRVKFGRLIIQLNLARLQFDPSWHSAVSSLFLLPQINWRTLLVPFFKATHTLLVNKNPNLKRAASLILRCLDVGDPRSQLPSSFPQMAMDNKIEDNIEADLRPEKTPGEDFSNISPEACFPLFFPIYLPIKPLNHFGSGKVVFSDMSLPSFLAVGI